MFLKMMIFESLCIVIILLKICQIVKEDFPKKKQIRATRLCQKCMHESLIKYVCFCFLRVRVFFYLFRTIQRLPFFGLETPFVSIYLFQFGWSSIWGRLAILCHLSFLYIKSMYVVLSLFAWIIGVVLILILILIFASLLNGLIDFYERLNEASGISRIS